MRGMKSNEAKKIEADLKAYVQQLRHQIAANVAIIKQSRKNLDDIRKKLARLKDAQSRVKFSASR
jgi:septal ring factor EnvC (AmiA/AmiB activator)